MAESSHPVIVIGAGLAGWTTVREFRKRDALTPVTLITTDSGDFYAKPSLSNAFAQKRTPSQLVTTPAAKMVQDLNVTLLAQAQVLSFNPAAHTLQVAQGGSTTTTSSSTTTLHYRQLVLATGAQAIRVPVQGTGAEQVLSVNSLDDFSVFFSAIGARAISADSYENSSKSIVIMGAGLIGCEFANDLLLGGHRVQVVDPSDRPLAALLPAAASHQLKDALGALGVQWYFGTTVEAVDAAESVDAGHLSTKPRLAVRLANGVQLQADVVLSAIGLRAHTQLAQAAGLACERGVVVDAHLQTSAPDVYALGDCAQYASAGRRILPFVMPIMHAARALGATLAGTPTVLAFPLMPVSVKTPALPMVVASAHPEQAGHWASNPQVPLGMWQFLDPQGVQLGFVLTGPNTAARMAQVQITQVS